MKPGRWETLKINYANPVPVGLAQEWHGPWDNAPNLGNGRLGARMHGQVKNEVITLNEITLWSGYLRDWNDPAILSALKEIRQQWLPGLGRTSQCRHLEAHRDGRGKETSSLLGLLDDGRLLSAFRESWQMQKLIHALPW